MQPFACSEDSTYYSEHQMGDSVHILRWALEAVIELGIMIISGQLALQSSLTQH
jgi:hypothetical protein